MWTLPGQILADGFGEAGQLLVRCQMPINHLETKQISKLINMLQIKVKMPNRKGRMNLQKLEKVAAGNSD